jgi:hypothetical protein
LRWLKGRAKGFKVPGGIPRYLEVLLIRSIEDILANSLPLRESREKYLYNIETIKKKLEEINNSFEAQYPGQEIAIKILNEPKAGSVLVLDFSSLKKAHYTEIDDLEIDNTIKVELRKGLDVSEWLRDKALVDTMAGELYLFRSEDMLIRVGLGYNAMELLGKYNFQDSSQQKGIKNIREFFNEEIALREDILSKEIDNEKEFFEEKVSLKDGWDDISNIQFIELDVFDHKNPPKAKKLFKIENDQISRETLEELYLINHAKETIFEKAFDRIATQLKTLEIPTRKRKRGDETPNSDPRLSSGSNSSGTTSPTDSKKEDSDISPTSSSRKTPATSPILKAQDPKPNPSPIKPKSPRKLSNNPTIPPRQ